MNTATDTNVTSLPSSTKPQTNKEVILANVQLLIEQLEAGHSEPSTPGNSLWRYGAPTRLELECVQCSPHRHLNNSGKMQLFPFWSLETEFPLPVSLAELRLGRDLHRPNAEAPQIAEVYLADAIVQDESGFRDLDPIVGADTTLQCTRTPECYKQ